MCVAAYHWRCIGNKASVPTLYYLNTNLYPKMVELGLKGYSQIWQLTFFSRNGETGYKNLFWKTTNHFPQKIEDLQGFYRNYRIILRFFTNLIYHAHYRPVHAISYSTYFNGHDITVCTIKSNNPLTNFIRE